MTLTMRERGPECNGEAVAAIAELRREEVERRFALESDDAERERLMHEVLRIVREHDLRTIADRFDTAELVYAGHVDRRHEEASPTYTG